MKQIAPQAKKIGQKNAPASFSMVFFRFQGALSSYPTGKDRLCSMTTGAPTPWRSTTGSSSRSQRRARSLHRRHFEFLTTAREKIG